MLALLTVAALDDDVVDAHVAKSVDVLRRDQRDILN